MIPRTEYPRPTLVRKNETWECLNGEWDFAFDSEKLPAPRKIDWKRETGKITVPFVPESKLSGVMYTGTIYRAYYHKTVNIKKIDGRIILHIGAADYFTEVFVGGKLAGEHRGGYTPSSYDITELVRCGENEIEVSVFDDNENPLQPSGKQAAEFPHGCFYTHCTGIWQTVWLEYLPGNHIKNVKIVPHFELEGDTFFGIADITVETSCDGDVSGTVRFGEKAEAQFSAHAENNISKAKVKIKDPILWDIGEGNLYYVDLSFGEDSAFSYFAFREIKAENNKLYLNGKELFMKLLLDQGYYPDGIYTAENEDDFARDIGLCMEAGFNGSRMHMKVFEPGFIREADRRGYLLWGEYPNWGLDISKEEALDVMLPEWEEALMRDMNHPSIIGWCPFNEAFPGENTGIIKEVVKRTRELDSSRLIIDTSGYVHSDMGDVYDVHDYEQSPETFAAHYEMLPDGEGVYENPFDATVHYDGKSPYFVSEFGGAFFDLDAEHENGEQESGNPWGYGIAPKNENEFVARFNALTAVLKDNGNICGYCYTQFCDVMQEMNGIFTFDRRKKFKDGSLIP